MQPNEASTRETLLSALALSFAVPAHPTSGVFPICVLCEVSVWVLPSVSPRLGLPWRGASAVPLLNKTSTAFDSYLFPIAGCLGGDSPICNVYSRHFAMKVRVRVRDHTLEINVGQGSQRLKCLAVISLQRF